MSICLECKNLELCRESGYDIDFLKRVMLSLSSSSTYVVKLVHKDGAKERGYDIDEVIQFLRSNKEKCFIYNLKRNIVI